MNSYYIIMVEGRQVYTSSSLSDIANKVQELGLKEGEYRIEEHGSWGAV